MRKMLMLTLMGEIKVVSHGGGLVFWPDSFYNKITNMMEDGGIGSYAPLRIISPWPRSRINTEAM